MQIVYLAKTYNSCRDRPFRFVYCESFSRFGTESGVAKRRKASLCKDNVTRKQSRHNGSRVVLKMASKYDVISTSFPNSVNSVRLVSFPGK